ncbi:MAG: hypothetical protein HP491_10325 [Nitrospira sp.]|nr:hypothetical protein [Nitrospira sp.]
MQQAYAKTSALILSGVLLLSGCTSTLVRDDVKRTAGLDGHCSGSEWADNSSLAVLPVPVVAFIVPHFDLHKVSSEPYLSRCGASTRVVNRDVSVNPKNGSQRVMSAQFLRSTRSEGPLLRA